MRRLILAGSAILAAACGPSSTESCPACTVDAGPRDAGNRPNDAGPTPDAGPARDAGPTGGLQTGLLIGGSGGYPGGIGGVHFRTPNVSGFTTDAGAFNYYAGETVTFSVADVDLRPTAAAAWVSPWQLAAQGQCAQSPELVRLLTLLYSLDVDGDLTNGIQIPAAGPGATQRAFSALADADVAALINRLVPGRAAVDGGLAVNDFITQMDNETWLQIGLTNFSFLTQNGGLRSQGVATDGAAFYFSYQYGLEKTDLAYNVLKDVGGPLSPPWPLAQTLLGDNHMGDVDYWNGQVYSGLEDGSAYVHPYLMTFDSTLTVNNTWALSPTLMTAGVPWAAVDGPHGHIIIANWDPTPALFLMDITNGGYLSSIPLSQTLGRIQGAKMYENALYACTDDANKTIYKIDMETGTVIPLWQFGFTMENEGCVFLPMSDGSLLHTLNVDSAKLGMDFRHHQRTRAPLRKSVCP